MAPTPLDSIKAIETFKNLILDQVRAIRGHGYSTTHHTFSVITSSLDLVSGTTRKLSHMYLAQAIVYTMPCSFGKWKLLAQGDMSYSTREAVESLYRNLQEQASQITCSMLLGDICNGLEIEHQGPQDAEAD